MREVLLMDSGPLVSWMVRDDKTHDWVSEEMEKLPETFITCEPVLSEVCFIVARLGGDPIDVVRLVRAGRLIPAFRVRDEASALEVLMHRYLHKPMSLADACLVRLSELHKDCRVFTLDRHFKQYRRFGRSVIPLLSPW